MHKSLWTESVKLPCFPTLDKIPYIGLYYKSNPNLYVATVFNK